MAARAPLTLSVVDEALKKCMGNMAGAARALGVDRTTVWKFVKRHPELNGTLEILRESMLDNAETALNKAILEGESWAVCFFLKTQGRKRGYASTAGSVIHPLLNEIRQAESDLLTVLGQLLLTPRSRSASRLTGEEIQQEIPSANAITATLLKLMP